MLATDMYVYNKSIREQFSVYSNCTVSRDIHVAYIHHGVFALKNDSWKSSVIYSHRTAILVLVSNGKILCLIYVIHVCSNDPHKYTLI